MVASPSPDERAFQLTARALQLTATEASVFPGYIRTHKAACRGILTNHYVQGCFRGWRREEFVYDGEEVQPRRFVRHVVSAGPRQKRNEYVVFRAIQSNACSGPQASRPKSILITLLRRDVGTCTLARCAPQLGLEGGQFPGGNSNLNGSFLGVTTTQLLVFWG